MFDSIFDNSRIKPLDEIWLKAKATARTLDSCAELMPASKRGLRHARKIRTRVDLYPSTRIAMNALFVPDCELAAALEPRAHSERGPVNELKRNLSPNRPRKARVSIAAAAELTGSLRLARPPRRPRWVRRVRRRRCCNPGAEQFDAHDLGGEVRLRPHAAASRRRRPRLFADGGAGRPRWSFNASRNCCRSCASWGRSICFGWR